MLKPLAVGCVLIAGAAMMPSGAGAQKLSLDEKARVEAAVEKVVAATRVPSVEVGVARGGKVVYTEAFGTAILPRNVASAASDSDGKMSLSETTTKAVKARAGMAYPIGSISKQFTAACILLLQERGKLKLDDPVSKWFPNFTRANDVTLRNLLTHTSGYSDYAPQDYTIPAWTKPVKPIDLITTWATKPLDLEPGTKWQYSNTNFQMAALIVEKVSGQTYHDFLWANVITPLKLEGVLDLDTDRAQLEVRGYEQHALGPMRPAILEAPGWYFGDGGLAMPVATLLQWDESIVHRTLLKPESYAAMETDFVLKDGTPSHYGLGVFVRGLPGGGKVIYHSGEVGGYVSNNVVDLQDDVAWAALTNEEASSAAGRITNAMRGILVPALAGNARGRGAAPEEQANVPAVAAGEDASAAQVRAVVGGLQEGTLNRPLLTEDAQFYFTPQTTQDYEASLAPLGALTQVRKTSESLRGGMTFRSYDLKFEQGTASLTTYTQPDGKLEQFLVGPAE